MEFCSFRQRNFAKKFRVGVNIYNPNLNILGKLSWPEFGSGSDFTGTLKILSHSELSWLEAWITLILWNTLRFLSP